MKSILIIDDEKVICDSIKMILEYENYHVDYSTDVQEGLEKLKFSNFQALLLDIQMPGTNGFEALEWIKANEIKTTVIMISAFGSLENAIKATKLGAFDFLEKPIDREKLIISVRNAVQHNSLEKENEQLKKDLESEYSIIGQSESIKRIFQTIDKVAPTDARILITGENGTGKELVAREIHKQSNRADMPLIEVNCAAIPNELIESELFGHEKGSFTGASQQRIGKFELANGGTLFLDEIGDMSLQAQAKVLKAIEDGQIERVGGSKKLSVDVRIIAATNKNLIEEIKEQRFREDLFHRLNVIPISIPPLRERKSDIPLLVNHFLKNYAEKNRIPLKEISEDAIEIIKAQDFTGNVRQLKNLVERILIMSNNNIISKKDVELLITPVSSNSGTLINSEDTFQEFKEKAERAYILYQLENHQWNISKTAEAIDIQRSHLYGKMKKYNIEKGNN